MSELLDLNELAPKPQKVKLGEDFYDVNPPETVDVLELAALGGKLQDANKMQPDELKQLFNDIRAKLEVPAPFIKDKKLSSGQLMGLLTFVIKMGMPPQAEELQNKGITAESPKE